MSILKLANSITEPTESEELDKEIEAQKKDKKLFGYGALGLGAGGLLAIRSSVGAGTRAGVLRELGRVINNIADKGTDHEIYNLSDELSERLKLHTQDDLVNLSKPTKGIPNKILEFLTNTKGLTRGNPESAYPSLGVLEEFSDPEWHTPELAYWGQNNGTLANQSPVFAMAVHQANFPNSGMKHWEYYNPDKKNEIRELGKTLIGMSDKEENKSGKGGALALALLGGGLGLGGAWLYSKLKKNNLEDLRNKKREEENTRGYKLYKKYKNYLNR